MAMEGWIAKAIEEERVHKPRINLVNADLFHRTPPENLIPPNIFRICVKKRKNLSRDATS